MEITVLWNDCFCDEHQTMCSVLSIRPGHNYSKGSDPLVLRAMANEGYTPDMVLDAMATFNLVGIAAGRIHWLN